MVDNTVLEEDVVRSKWECPGCCRWCEKRHWHAETDLGSHIVNCIYRSGDVVDHKTGLVESEVEFGGMDGVRLEKDVFRRNQHGDYDDIGSSTDVTAGILDLSAQADTLFREGCHTGNSKIISSPIAACGIQLSRACRIAVVSIAPSAISVQFRLAFQQSDQTMLVEEGCTDGTSSPYVRWKAVKFLFSLDFVAMYLRGWQMMHLPILL